MALVAFLRGVNVGGHRTFRPSLLARELADFGVVNIGAAGTLVVRKPGSRSKFLAALRSKLPFETHIVLCDGRDILRVFNSAAAPAENPFGKEASAPDVTRFVSVFAQPFKPTPGALKKDLSLPFSLPEKGKWLVRLVAADGQFVFGMYRRDMKTIGYLGQVDKLFGGLATARNWNTITAVARILKAS
jgi:uncharacterized protein (DUF1697 family)